MVRFNERYDGAYPRYTKEQLKPEFRSASTDSVNIPQVMVVNMNNAVLHSYQRLGINTVGQIQQGLAFLSNPKLSNANRPAEVLALFQGIDYTAYSKVAVEVCSRWHDPRSIINDLEKAILLDRR
ncbi:MAG: hypothetical protein V2A62_05080 [Candidatus Woesearchaeota archaeon]